METNQVQITTMLQFLEEGVTDAFFNSFFYENSTMKMCHSLSKL